MDFSVCLVFDGYSASAGITGPWHYIYWDRSCCDSSTTPTTGDTPSGTLPASHHHHMEQRPLPPLLRSLLDICLQCARRSLHWLLRLLSAVSPRLLNASRFVGQDSDKGRYESKQPPDLTSGRQDGHDNAPRQPVVFMACSTTPKRPPPARSRTRHTSYESYHIGPTCSSPTSTLRQASDTLFPSLKSPKSLTSCLSEEDGNVTDEFHAPSGERFAEPASVVAHPDKQFKTILPSQSSRYDRNVPM